MICSAYQPSRLSRLLPSPRIPLALVLLLFSSLSFGSHPQKHHKMSASAMLDYEEVCYAAALTETSTPPLSWPSQQQPSNRKNTEDFCLLQMSVVAKVNCYVLIARALGCSRILARLLRQSNVHAYCCYFSNKCAIGVRKRNIRAGFKAI